MTNHNIVVRCYEDLYVNSYYPHLKFKINMHSFEINRIEVRFNSCEHKMTSSKNDLSINVLYFSFERLNLIDLNIFYLLKLIFTFKSCAFSYSNFLNKYEIPTQLYLFIFSSLLWLSLWRVINSLSALYSFATSYTLLKYFDWDNCSIHLFWSYQSLRLWSKLKAGKHYEHC